MVSDIQSTPLTLTISWAALTALGSTLVCFPSSLISFLRLLFDRSFAILDACTGEPTRDESARSDRGTYEGGKAGEAGRERGTYELDSDGERTAVVDMLRGGYESTSRGF